MKRFARCFLVMAILVTTSALAADTPQSICQALRAVSPSADDQQALRACEKFLREASAAAIAQFEPQAAGLLTDKQVAADVKDFLCRQAACFGADQTAAAFAALQSDPARSSAACAALQRMGTPAARSALRTAAARQSGRQLLDALAALGALGDQPSVPLLAGLLQQSDPQARRAAVIALGAIGTADAEKALAQFEPSAPAEVRALVGDARLRCAARLSKEQGLTIARTYLTSPVAALRSAAFQQLLQAQPEERSTRLLAAIRDSDPALQSVALLHLRQPGDASLTRQLAAALPKLSSGDQAAVLEALAARGDGGVAATIEPLIKSAAAEVRQAALAALGILGNAAHVDQLLDATLPEADASTAREALGRLRGAEVNRSLIARAREGAPARRGEAIQALAARGAREALPMLLSATSDREPLVRQRTFAALRVLAQPQEYAELIKQLVASSAPDARRGLLDALVAVWRRAPQPESCLRQLLQAKDQTTGESHLAVLQVLCAIGGPDVLPVIRQSLATSDPELCKGVLRALANWPDSQPVEQLIDLARSGGTPAIKILALQTAIALVGRDAGLAPDAKVARFDGLLKLAARPEERRLLAGQLPSAACAGSLALAERLLADKATANEAALALAALAANRRLTATPQAVKAALEKARQAATLPAVQRRVDTQLKTRQ